MLHLTATTPLVVAIALNSKKLGVEPSSGFCFQSSNISDIAASVSKF